jgi:hypothetical protein
MKNRIVILLLALICQFSFGQINKQKTVRGHVVNDLIQVDNGYVFNVNSKTRTFIDAKGFFDIVGKPKDTLLISSLAFKAKKIILSELNMGYPLLVVSLELFENRLDEVVVSNKKEISLISDNTQSIVDKKYFGDKQSSVKNTSMPSEGPLVNGTDFVRIYKDVLKIVKKKQPEGSKGKLNLDFTMVALKNMKQSFFLETLKLKDDEIGLFLAFCDNDPNSKKFLDSKAEFDLIEFLISKNEEFKRITTFEK